MIEIPKKFVFNDPNDCGVRDSEGNKPSPNIEDIKREWFTKGLREGVKQMRELLATLSVTEGVDGNYD